MPESIRNYEAFMQIDGERKHAAFQHGAHEGWLAAKRGETIPDNPYEEYAEQIPNNLYPDHGVRLAGFDGDDQPELHYPHEPDGSGQSAPTPEAPASKGGLDLSSANDLDGIGGSDWGSG